MKCRSKHEANEGFKNTAARRSRPTRDGLRQNKSLRVGPRPTASADAGFLFVEIGHVQLSHLMTQARDPDSTHQTGVQINGSQRARGHDEEFLHIGEKQPWSLLSLGLA